MSTCSIFHSKKKKKNNKTSSPLFSPLTKGIIFPAHVTQLSEHIPDTLFNPIRTRDKLFIIPYRLTEDEYEWGKNQGKEKKEIFFVALLF